MTLLTMLTMLTVALSSPAPQKDAASQIWHNLQQLCGRAFAGKVVEAPPNDTTFAGKTLVMHVRECTPTVVRVPFHVGEDRSRTWVLTRTASGIRLKHDHRHEDGSEDKLTQYGGESRRAEGATRLEFPADAQTIEVIPEAKTNVWTVELEPGKLFVYALRREGTDRRFRIEFDLSRSVTPPPAPWGAGKQARQDPTPPASGVSARTSNRTVRARDRHGGGARPGAHASALRAPAASPLAAPLRSPGNQPRRS